MEESQLVYTISVAIDLAGVVIIALGAALGIVLFVRDFLIRHDHIKPSYDRLRTFLGRSLLLGLEFLVAGDIIKTVAVEPTLDSVLALAVIVLVRTVLSISIDVEIDGHWPWNATRIRLMQRSGGESEVPAFDESAQTAFEGGHRTAPNG